MYIDIHNHGAWGIDDGIENQEHAEELLEQAKEDGIIKIIATPHIVAGQNDDAILEIKQRIHDFQKLAMKYDIEVYEGNEVFLNSSYLDLMEHNQFMTLAGSQYVLVEFKTRINSCTSDEKEEMLYEIILRGYIPIIAHAERYFPKGISSEEVKRWIEMGCYIQINRTSYLGLHGEQLKENTNELLHAGLVHVIASDAHRSSGTRVCTLNDVYQKLKRKFGEENANLLCHENPLHIIEKQPLEQMKQRPPWIQRWKKR